MKNTRNSTEIQVPAGPELDGIGKWLMKIAQRLSRQFGIPVEDAYQDAVLCYLKRRHFYSVERGARSTFASLAAGRTLHTLYTRNRAKYAVQQDFDITITESSDTREIPDAAYGVTELPRRDRRKELVRVLRESGWSETEIKEISVSSARKSRRRVEYKHDNSRNS